MSEMSILQRLEFLTEKARQAVDRTSHITSYHEFLSSPEGLDIFDATVLRIQVTGEMLKQIEDLTQGQLLTPHYPQIPWRAVLDYEMSFHMNMQWLIRKNSSEY